MSLNEATEIKASFKTANFFLTQFTSCLALKYHKSRPRSFLVPVFVLFFLVSAWSRIHKSWADNKVTLQTSILSMCVVVLGKTDCSWNGVKQLSPRRRRVDLSRVITVCVIATSTPDDNCCRLPFVGIPLHLRRPEDELSRSDSPSTTVKVSGRDTRVVSAGPDHSITQVNTTSPPPHDLGLLNPSHIPFPYWTSSLLHTQKKQQAKRNGRKNNH